MIYNFEELTFQILNVDRFVHKKGVLDVKARPYAALSFRESGTGYFEADGKYLAVKPGDILFIPADMPYRVEYSVSESLVIHLYECNYRNVESFSADNRTLFSLLFQNLCRDWQNARSVNHAKSEIYHLLEMMADDRKTSAENAAFARCVGYIDRNFCNPTLKMDEVCLYGFVSPSSLQRMFAKNFGISPKRYLTKLRLEKALRDLAENRLSVKEIAFGCGFSDEKHFSEVFKNKYGYPPSQLRKHISD